MSTSHLGQLRAALVRRGWKVTERLRGDDGVNGAATWLIQRSTTQPILWIDFAGYGPLGADISLEESYACKVRESEISLYFSRLNRSRQRWLKELHGFIAALDQFVK